MTGWIISQESQSAHCCDVTRTNTLRFHCGYDISSLCRFVANSLLIRLIDHKLELVDTEVVSEFMTASFAGPLNKVHELLGAHPRNIPVTSIVLENIVRILDQRLLGMQVIMTIHPIQHKVDQIRFLLGIPDTLQGEERRLEIEMISIVLEGQEGMSGIVLTIIKDDIPGLVLHIREVSNEITVLISSKVPADSAILFQELRRTCNAILLGELLTAEITLDPSIHMKSILHLVQAIVKQQDLFQSLVNLRRLHHSNRFIDGGVPFCHDVVLSVYLGDRPGVRKLSGIQMVLITVVICFPILGLVNVLE